MYNKYLVLFLLIFTEHTIVSGQNDFLQKLFEAQVYQNDKIKLEIISDCNANKNKRFFSYSHLKYLSLQRDKLKKYISSLNKQSTYVYFMEGISIEDDSHISGYLWNNKTFSVAYSTFSGKNNTNNVKIVEKNNLDFFGEDWAKMRTVINDWDMKKIIENHDQIISDGQIMIASRITIKNKRIVNIETIVFEEF